MSKIVELEIFIDFSSGEPFVGSSCPAKASVNNLLQRLRDEGFDIDDLLFSGHPDFPGEIDGTEIDRQKLEDEGPKLDHEVPLLGIDDKDVGHDLVGSREFANSRAIDRDKLNDLLQLHAPPDPDYLIKKLCLDGIDAESSGDFDEAERIKEKIADLRLHREEMLAKRQAIIDEFEAASRPEVPIYYCGDHLCLLDSNPEDNPFSYAQGGTGMFILVSEGSFELSHRERTGYLSIYSKAKLKAAGAEIKMLDEETSRNDRQFIVFANFETMEKGKVAVVTCFFDRLAMEHHVKGTNRPTGNPDTSAAKQTGRTKSAEPPGR